MIYYASQVVSVELANSVYYCYLFGSSIDTFVTKRISTFADFTDFYTSFLFNLLSQSLSIKTLAGKIQTDTTNSNWVDLSFQVSTIIRLILDFQSSNAEGLTSSDTVLDPV